MINSSSSWGRWPCGHPDVHLELVNLLAGHLGVGLLDGLLGRPVVVVLAAVLPHMQRTEPGAAAAGVGGQPQPLLAA